MSQAATFSHGSFKSQLKKYYTFYTGGFIAFLLALASRRADGHVA